MPTYSFVCQVSFAALGIDLLRACIKSLDDAPPDQEGREKLKGLTR